MSGADRRQYDRNKEEIARLRAEEAAMINFLKEVLRVATAPGLPIDKRPNVLEFMENDLAILKLELDQINILTPPPANAAVRNRTQVVINETQQMIALLKGEIADDVAKAQLEADLLAILRARLSKPDLTLAADFIPTNPIVPPAPPPTGGAAPIRGSIKIQFSNGNEIEIQRNNDPEELDAVARTQIRVTTAVIRNSLNTALGTRTELQEAERGEVLKLMHLQLADFKDKLSQDQGNVAHKDAIADRLEIIELLNGDLSSDAMKRAAAEAKLKVVLKDANALGKDVTFADNFIPDASVTLQPIDPNDPDDVQGVANTAAEQPYEGNENIKIEENKHQNPYYEFGMALAQAAQHSLTLTLIHYLIIKPFIAPLMSELRGDLNAIGCVASSLLSFSQTFAGFRDRCAQRSLETPGLLSIPIAAVLWATGNIDRYQFYNKLTDNIIGNVARSFIPQIIQDKFININRSDNVFRNLVAFPLHLLIGAGLSVVNTGLLTANMTLRILGRKPFDIIGVSNAADAHIGAAFSNIGSLVKSAIDLIVPLGIAYNLYTGGLTATGGYLAMFLPFVTRAHDPQNGAGRVQAGLYSSLGFNRTNHFGLCVEALQRTWRGRSVGEGDAASNAWTTNFYNFLFPENTEAPRGSLLSRGQRLRWGLVVTLPFLLAAGLVFSGAAVTLAGGALTLVAGAVGSAGITATAAALTAGAVSTVVGLSVGVVVAGVILGALGWLVNKLMLGPAARFRDMVNERRAARRVVDEDLGSRLSSRASAGAGFDLGSTGASASARSSRVGPGPTGGMLDTGMTHGFISAPATSTVPPPPPPGLPVPPPPPGMGSSAVSPLGMGSRSFSSAGISIGEETAGITHEPGRAARAFAAMRRAVAPRGEKSGRGLSTTPAAAKATGGGGSFFTALRGGVTMGVSGPSSSPSAESGAGRPPSIEV